MGTDDPDTSLVVNLFGSYQGTWACRLLLRRVGGRCMLTKPAFQT